MQHIERSFFQLYGDSIWHANKAISSASTASVDSQKYTRASIMSSSIAFECAANCSIPRLVQSKQLQEDTDKLSALSKFELAAVLNDGSFDRGDNRVACMKELISLRNEYVHPKTSNIQIEISDISETGTHYKVQMALSGKHLPSLGIDRISKFWFPKDALSVVAKCTEFYNWFFLECLNFNKKEVLGILAPLIYPNNDINQCAVFHQEYLVSELKLLTDLGIKIEFLDLDVGS